MKHLFILLIASLFSILTFAGGDTYSRIKIAFGDKDPAQLWQAGIEVQWIDKSGEWAIAELMQNEIAKVAGLGFTYEVVIQDVAAYYADRYLHPQNYTAQQSDAFLNETWPVPDNFELGTCGGFSTIEQMFDQIELMHTLYPNLITVKQAVSDSMTTINGLDIYYVKISDNPGINEDEPEILYTGMHHAREPIGMQHLLFYMWHLLENYNTDPLIKALIDTTEMYFVPVINMDGYTYNIDTYPNGGGMWRKNRRPNQNGSYGIDINRNYGYMWGYDNTGSSPDPNEDTFRGTAAFSEPETRMMKYFCEEHDFGIALNYHSYSNLFLYPWGYVPELCPDDQLFNTYSKMLTVENGYTYGPASTTIYPTNGGSDDWMYGEQTTKNKILAWTPEIGSQADGFWPMQSRIIPLCQENMFQSLRAAQLVGNFALIKDLSPMVIGVQQGYFNFNIKRYGLLDGDFTVTITPLNSSIATVGEPKAYTSLQLLESLNDSIAFTLDPLIMSGDTLKYVLSIDNGSYVMSDTLLKYYGVPLVILNDSLNTITGWTGNWALTSNKYVSPQKSMTDSPSGNYSNNANKSTTTANALSLQNAMFAMLEFYAQWNIEAGYDYVQVKISTNNGLTWSPLTGIYTHPGNSNQAQGQPLYDGVQTSWVKETILLNDYLGENVIFRFTLKSDAGTVADGFYFDDFKVSILADPTGISPAAWITEGLLGNLYPNPAHTEVMIPVSLPKNQEAEISVYSLTGKLMRSFMIDDKISEMKVDVSDFVQGVYFVRMVSDKSTIQVKKLIIN